MAISTINSNSMGASSVLQPAVATGVSGTGPAFRAYLSGTQSVTDSVSTKLVFDSETFDTASCFNNTGSTVGGIPAYSFLPNVAGYYVINAGGYAKTTLNTQAYSQITISKNGSDYKAGSFIWIGGGGVFNWSTSVVSDIVYLNGTTDYVSIYGVISGSSPLYQGTSGSYATSFSGALVRAA